MGQSEDSTLPRTSETNLRVGQGLKPLSSVASGAESGVVVGESFV